MENNKNKVGVKKAPFVIESETTDTESRKMGYCRDVMMANEQQRRRQRHFAGSITCKVLTPVLDLFTSLI